ncbi:hypothetical protein N7481_007509 [Penicillium waksmanii]|uniref:uncharacterized protein n=1 Tax=Penicillium waksmanii TaxID=69791 RepID=UPI002546BF00|nr:uncharacterized protein N7481_007509 [Penicillium waksmanii]KAJ5980211.1 hypothetical protein N7481_007509 [Penicillium waksmanii]
MTSSQMQTVYKAAPGEDYADVVRKAVDYAIEVQQGRDADRNFYSDQMIREDTAQLLLDPSLDMNFKENGFGAAIQAASRAGHDDAVAVLLKVEGIDVNIEGACGDERIIIRLLEAKADINAQNGTYGTAFIAASRRSHYQIVKLLIKEGAAVNVQAGVYGTALQAAARSGDIGLVLLLLNHRAMVNLKAGDYCTALQAAARDGFVNITKTLIEHGADININSGRLNTALQAAATGGHVRLVPLLVVIGTEYGDSLMSACFGGYQDVVQYLLECGVDLIAESTGFGTAGRHLSLVRFLLTKGADPNNSGWAFGTPLQFAAIKGDTDLVQALLDKGADPVKPGRNHANGGSKNIVKILLKALRCSKDSPSPRDRSVALRAASKLGYLEIIQLILNEGFDPSDMTKALSAAIETGQEKVVQFLLGERARIDFDGLKFACCRGYLNLVRLYRQQCDPIFAAVREVPPLLVASIHGQVEVVREILSAKVDIDENYHRLGNSHSSHLKRGSYRGTALHAALIGGHHTILNMLLERNVNTDIFESHSWDGKLQGTVLHLASSSQCPEIIQALLNHNAHVNAISGKYGTALQAAAYAGNIGTVRLLLENGAEVNTEGGYFGTALQAAAS